MWPSLSDLLLSSFCLFLVLLSPVGAFDVARDTQIDYYARNLKTITEIYNTTIWPNCKPILANGSAAVRPGLFNANAAGRVTPLGNFTGFSDSTEYFFALTPIPGDTGPGILAPMYKTFTKATINHFASSCPNVASSVVYLDTTIVHPGSADDGKHVSTLKQVAFWRFDDSGAVLYYDAWIPNLALWTTKLFGVNLGDGQVINNLLAVLTNLCEQIQARCTKGNQQYLDVATCTLQLQLFTRFGTFDEVWGNDVVCRLIHVILTKIRPEVHCPHVGPTGGGKCVDVEYDAVYIDQDQSLFGGLAAPFMCP